MTGLATITVTPVQVATVTLSPMTATLVPSQPLMLSVTLKDSQGALITGRSVTWSSADEAVATISASGAVTALAPGSVKLTATVDGKSAQATVTVVDGGWVTAAGGTVRAAGGHVAMTVGAGAVATGMAITVTPLAMPPANPHLVPGTAHDLGPSGTTFAQPVAVSLSYEAANVGSAAPANFRLHRYASDAWMPVAGSTVNTTTRVVTGTTSSLGQYAILSVPPLVSSVTVSPATPQVDVGGTVTLTAVLRNAQGTVVTGPAIEWASGNPAMAKVSTTGVVTGVSAGGPVTITASSEGVTGSAQVNVVSTIVLASIASGWKHSCGLTPAGEALCWGQNGDGQLGTGTANTDDSPRPVRVAGGHVFSQIVAGGEFSCARTAAGMAYCWGDSYSNALGDGARQDRAEPTAVSGGHVFTTMTAGRYHACGLIAGGAALCWGSNGYGEIGDGTNTQRAVPTAVVGGLSFRTIAAGDIFTCALTQAGAAYCWGYFKNLGDGSGVSRSTPVAVVGGHTFKEIVAGGLHACGLTLTGEAWCWGDGASGELGDGGFVRRPTPVKVAGNNVFLALQVGYEHSCGLLAGNQIKCWGYNEDGQVGDSTFTDRNTPVPVVGGVQFMQLATSGVSYHTCALATSGTPWCWGWNKHGQLGDGSKTDRNQPVRVLPLPPNR